MTIAWNLFTPWSALTGGVIIGIAVSMLLLLNGRVAGISGIVGGLFRPVRADVAWRIAFIAGLVGAPLAFLLVAPLPGIVVDAGYAALVLAGLLVGIGTRYGAGCTSGHGVCGIARASPRSIVATLVFMGAGFGTTFVVRHVLAG